MAAYAGEPAKYDSVNAEDDSEVRTDPGHNPELKNRNFAHSGYKLTVSRLFQ